MINIKNEFGTTIYTENVLENIVGIEIESVPGVVGKATKSASDVLGVLQKDNYSKGIKITSSQDNNTIVIEIAVIVSYGIKFSEVSKNIMIKVKDTIEKLTDLKVSDIIVTIHGVKVVDQ